MWEKLKRLLLPFEFEDHPLHSPPHKEEEIDEELGEALDSLGPYPEYIHPKDAGWKLLPGSKMIWRSPDR